MGLAKTDSESNGHFVDEILDRNLESFVIFERFNTFS